MRIRILPVLMISFTLLCCKEVTKEARPAIEITETKPKTSLNSLYEDLEGNAVKLSDFEGKRVLLNYWATWCGPCIEEMPDLEQLQNTLQPANYVFLFASDQSLAKINNFKISKGFNFNYIKYNGNYPDHNISALPVTLIFNETGEQVIRFDGVMDWTNPEIVEQLKNIK